MWTKTKKKARLRRAQRAALMNGAQGKIFTVTYQDYQKPEVLRTDLNDPLTVSVCLRQRENEALPKGGLFLKEGERQWEFFRD